MTSWIAQRHSKRERVCGRPAACVLAAALSASFVSLQLLAQGPTPAPPQLDVPPVQPIAWLDARKVGVHGLAVETNGLPYLTIDAQIDTIQSQIEKITLILQLAEAKRLDPTVDEVERTTAQGIISERRKDLADLQAKLASLLRQRELLQQFLERQQCGSGSREQAWKNAIATSQRVVDMLQPAEGRLVPELQEELTNHRRLIEEARGYLRDLTVECEAQKEEAFRREVEASIPGAVAKANKALDDAAPVVARGRFADMPAIRSRFAAAVPIERQLAYLGDPAADALLARVGEQFTTFVTKVAENCAGESFEPREAWALERQAELHGTQVDLLPCTSRVYEVGVPRTGLNARFCGGWPPGLQPSGTWQFRLYWRNLIADGTGTLPPGQFTLPPGTTARGGNDYRLSGAGTFNARDVEVRDPLERVETGFPADHGRRFSFHVTVHIEVRVRGTWRPGGELDFDDEDDDVLVHVLNNNKPCDPSRDVWSYK